MLPYLNFSFFGSDLHWNTNNSLYVFCFIICSVIYISILNKDGIPIWKPVLIAIITPVSAVVGGRLFHVFFERPELLKTPELIFTRYDGLTFYGAFFLGILVFFTLDRFLLEQSYHKKNWDLLALFTSFCFPVLKLGCFANGCCWGKISGVPWAVRFYDPESVMPLIGLPVHPVQLYDSLGGTIIFLLLLGLYKFSANYKGKLFAVFCVFYPILRFITEFYRADHFRGENLYFHLSTSQLLSIPVIIIALIYLKMSVKQSRTKQ